MHIYLRILRKIWDLEIVLGQIVDMKQKKDRTKERALADVSIDLMCLRGPAINNDLTKKT